VFLDQCLSPFHPAGGACWPMKSKHLSGITKRYRLPHSQAWLSGALGEAGRSAAQCGADGASAFTGIASEKRLGDFHGCNYSSR